MTKFIVTLHWPAPRPVPKYGQFLWSAEHGKLVWRNEIAETTGQLAELINQAIPFVRDQDDRFLWVEVLPVVEKAEDGGQRTEDRRQRTEDRGPEVEILEESDVEKLRSLCLSLRQANEEKQTVIDRITGGDEEQARSEGRGQKAEDGEKRLEDMTPEEVHPLFRVPQIKASTLSAKIASLPRTRNRTRRKKAVLCPPSSDLSHSSP